MSEEKTPGKATGEKPSNPDSKNSFDTNKFVQIIKDRLTEYRGEFRKIIWLSRKELIKRTITVIFTSMLFALVIFGMDSVFSILMQNYFLLIGK